MLQNDRSGLLFTAGGFILLSSGDAVIKTMSGMWAPTAIAALRYVAGAIGLCTLLFMAEGRAGFTIPRPGLQLLRGAAVAFATLSFFSALFVMQLAEATTIVFVSPILTAALAPLFRTTSHGLVSLPPLLPWPRLRSRSPPIRRLPLREKGTCHLRVLQPQWCGRPRPWNQ